MRPLSGSKAGRLKHRLDEQHRRDAAEAAKMDELRSLPKWKQEAAAAKKAAAEKKRRSQLTKEERKELDAQEASKKKAGVIRMKTIAKQVGSTFFNLSHFSGNVLARTPRFQLVHVHSSIFDCLGIIRRWKQRRRR